MDRILLLEKLNLKNIFLSFFFRRIVIIHDNRFIKIKFLRYFFLFNELFLLTSYSSSFSETDSLTREKVTKFLYNKKNYFVRKNLNQLLDFNGSESYFMKGSFHYLAIHQYFHIKYLLNKIFPSSQIYILKRNEILKDIGFKEVIKSNLFFDSIYVLKILIKLLLKYKVSFNIQKKKEFFLSSEISNHIYFNKKFGEPNYLDFDKVIYFKTSKKNFKHKYRFRFSSKENFIDLRKSNIQFKDLLKIIFFLRSIPNISDYKSFFFINLLNNYIEYSYLFLNYNIKFCQILESSNDLRAINLDSGIITSLANKYGTITFSYQTRSPYIVDSINFYSYINVYFSWSSFWGFNVKKKNYINYINFISPFKYLKKTNSKVKKISVFFHDVNDHSYSTQQYNLNFFNIICDLCIKHNQLKFFLKPKFNYLEYGFHNRQLPNNCILIKDNLYQTNQLIKNSDIILCIGFTSPGSYALAMNKPTLFYSELKSTHPINYLKITADNKKEFIKNFDSILENKISYLELNKILFSNNSNFKEFKEYIKQKLFTYYNS